MKIKDYAKNIAIGAALAGPCMCAGDAHATTGDHSVGDAVDHYFGGPQSGQTRALAIVAANITNWSQLETDVARMLPNGVAACTRANGCIVPISTTGSTSTGFPTTEVASDRDDAALMVAALHSGSQNAVVYVIDADGKNGTNFLASGKVPQNYPTLAIKGLAFAWGIALNDGNQTSLSSWLDTYPIFVTGAPGTVGWSGAVTLGLTDYTGSGADSYYTGSGADLGMLGKNVKRSKGGSDVTEDTGVLAPALTMALANSGTSVIYVRDDFFSADSAFFDTLAQFSLGVPNQFGPF